MINSRLPDDFYKRNCLEVAFELLGKILVRIKNGTLYSGIIVETEAYEAGNDEASHSFIGKTERNKMMFEEGGKAYVYFIYGNHYCFNVVTGRAGEGSAVLIRAVEPVCGIDQMMRNRKTTNILNLTNGPGKLTEAMEINMKLNGKKLSGNEIFISDNPLGSVLNISVSSRIGISRATEKLNRFYLKFNPFISTYFDKN
ncbi:MAG: DNA-3-methyladenine glycosylase [Ignavibacteria bacterium]|nr:DNA-3-methyladenine glycosylase [Ignavibacteria bacterium]